MEITVTSIRKFVYAALLVATTMNLAPAALAQEPACGRFTLTHEVHWGNAKVPAGKYQFSFGTDGIAPVLILTRISTPPATFMVLVPSTEEASRSDASRLLLETTADGSYVTAMQLPTFGTTLYFNVPRHVAEKQVTQATAPANLGQ